MIMLPGRDYVVLAVDLLANTNSYSINSYLCGILLLILTPHTVAM